MWYYVYSEIVPYCNFIGCCNELLFMELYIWSTMESLKSSKVVPSKFHIAYRRVNAYLSFI